MVKNAMKSYKNDKVCKANAFSCLNMPYIDNRQDLLRTLEARQLALKLIANVTYGYCGASATGRMPCAEIADAIVQSGRDTLERCIRKINTNVTWDAEVKYGDTDSLFVLLEGRGREDAFTIAKQMVDEITAENPQPVKLKFEKVRY